MGEIIYWKKFDEPKVVELLFGSYSYKHKMEGQYECSDERIEMCNFYGWLPTTITNPAELNLTFSALFKDGSRHDIKIELPCTQEGMIEQAEHYLASLNKQ